MSEQSKISSELPVGDTPAHTRYGTVRKLVSVVIAITALASVLLVLDSHQIKTEKEVAFEAFSDQIKSSSPPEQAIVPLILEYSLYRGTTTPQESYRATLGDLSDIRRFLQMLQESRVFSYRTTEGFGSEDDPLLSLSLRHQGLDFSARILSSRIRENVELATLLKLVQLRATAEVTTAPPKTEDTSRDHEGR